MRLLSPLLPLAKPSRFVLFLLMAAAQVPAAEFLVTRVDDSGPGSLRQAIEDSNFSPGPDTIHFNIPGTPPHRIDLLSALPSIEDSLTIEAPVADGSSARTIELNGENAGTEEDCLHIAANDCTIRGLCINGFEGYGIVVELAGRSRIQGNFIGTDPTGRIARPNGQAAIVLSDSAGNLIGGSGDTNRNLLSGNVTGLFLVGAGSFNNTVANNFIGTDLDGDLKLPNTRNGVLIFGAPGNTIGGATSAARNVISGNGQSGVYLIGGDATQNIISGNYIGINRAGTDALGNSVDGVTIFSAFGNTIGGTTEGARNIISGNTERGVLINGDGATDNLIQGNFIGSDFSGKVAVGNGFSGVGILNVPANTIGGETTGARNVISGNKQSGISIRLAGASNNIVRGNFIGTELTGSAALSNLLDGITISAPSNQIGGGTGTNVVSGNAQAGIFLTEATATGNVVEGNIVGCDVSGQKAVPNGQAGMQIESPGNWIGRPGAKPNLVSGNTLSGITLLGALATSNRVENNFVGTDITGRAAIPNVGGVFVTRAFGNQIGSTNVGGGNLVSGNRESGIYLAGPGCSNNIVQGNTVGATRDGQTALPNTGDGISLYSANNNIIGGPSLAAGNLVSGNDFAGIFLTHPNAARNIIQGNVIGLARDGITPLGNRAHGIEIEDFAGGNLIGGSSTNQGNRIAYSVANNASGVRVRSGTTNTIRLNSIFSNRGLGIDLGADGLTPNDANDADDGANRLLNFPVITSAESGLRTFVQVSAQSGSNLDLTVDFYISDKADESGYGEGVTWLATVPIKTDAGGSASISITFPRTFLGGKFLSATSTDGFGNTSEFSPARLIEQGDSDGDGLPDDFEIAHSFDPTGTDDSATDPDADGLITLLEFRAGTDPRDPLSTLKLQADRDSKGQTFLSFGSVLNRKYRIENADTVSGGWKTLKEITGTGATIQTPYSSASVQQRFYRLVVLP